MDWLRIGAFALLILYHVGMVFVPWGFHINADPPIRWLTWPMLALSPWRLSLLFLVSGYATRAMLVRAAEGGARGAFLADRSRRLLLPLAFGVAIIVPPQAWVELVVKADYGRGFVPFWLHDYFRFGMRDGVVLPSWNHLWFVAYLWSYTLALTLLLPLGRWVSWQRGFDRLFGGIGVLLLPLGWLALVHGWWFLMRGETHGLFDDGVAHASYFPAFLFGFALARSDRAMAALVRWRHAGLALAIIGYAVVLTIEIGWLGRGPVPRTLLRGYGIAHGVQQWGAIVALIAYAERHWNRDAPIRPMLTEAVFPLYLIHQTIIVVAMFLLRDAGLPPAVEFAGLAVATAALGWTFYLAGRRIGPLRPWIGLRRHARRIDRGPAPV